MAENLLIGKQKSYFRYFIHGHSVNKMAIDNVAIDAYAKAYTTYESLNVGFEWYRAFPENVSSNLSHTEPFDVPVLLVGAEFSMKESLKGMKESLNSIGVKI